MWPLTLIQLLYLVFFVFLTSTLFLCSPLSSTFAFNSYLPTSSFTQHSSFQPSTINIQLLAINCQHSISDWQLSSSNCFSSWLTCLLTLSLFFTHSVFECWEHDWLTHLRSVLVLWQLSCLMCSSLHMVTLTVDQQLPWRLPALTLHMPIST